MRNPLIFFLCVRIILRKMSSSSVGLIDLSKSKMWAEILINLKQNTPIAVSPLKYSIVSEMGHLSTWKVAICSRHTDGVFICVRFKHKDIDVWGLFSFMIKNYLTLHANKSLWAGTSKPNWKSEAILKIPLLFPNCKLKVHSCKRSYV